MKKTEKKILLWFFLAILFKQLFWMAFIPPWQFPDEQAHFAQVQNFVERRNVAPFFGPTTSKEIVESEKILGTLRDEFGNNKFTYHPEFRLPLGSYKTNESELRILQIPRDFRKQYEIHEATVYPPLYYVLGSIPYLIANDANLLTRIFAVRLINIPLFMLSLFFAYRTGRIIFENRNLLTFLILIFVGFHPMYSFVSAGTTSDNMYNMLSALTIYLCVLLIRNGFSARLIGPSIITSLLLWFTKPQAKLLLLLWLPAVFLVKRKKGMSLISIMFFLILITTPLAMMFVNFVGGKQFLPEISSAVFQEKSLSLADHLRWTLEHTYREVMPWYWGVYRWLSLTYPRVIHRIVNWFVLLSLIGILKYFFTYFKKRVVDIKYTLFFILANLVYFFGLFTFDYLFTRSNGFSIGIQGRYYFPLLITQMILIITGFLSLSTVSKLFKSMTLIVSLGVIIFHLYAQLFVSGSYLSSTTLGDFFIQASQFKPLWLKSPVLELLVATYAASLFVFLTLFTRYIYDNESQRV